jgi:hypothetical protein
MRPINKTQILIGGIALLTGLLVYLIDRPPGSTYFVCAISSSLSLYNILPNLFGPTGKILPSLVHVFSFALITAGLLACQKKGCLTVCSAWFVINGAFEMGQKFDTLCSRMVPDSSAGIPLLENSRNFFQQGTFDFFDLAATAVGAAAAYAVLVLTMKRRCAS